MNSHKRRELINNLQEIVDDLKIGALSSDRVQVTVIWDEQLSYIHYWDPRNDEPRVMYVDTKKVDEEIIIEFACRSLNLLGIKAHKFGVEWLSDLAWDALPENFQKLNQIYNVELKTLTDDQVGYIKENFNVIHSLQPELQIPETN